MPGLRGYLAKERRPARKKRLPRKGRRRAPGCESSPSSYPRIDNARLIAANVSLLFGVLYPAYASYKAVKNKDVRSHLQWMMYWIVFALFTCIETFSDIFISFWMPFYYEIKILFVLWLLSPVTKGSSLLYRRFVHPQLAQREQEIDELLEKAKEQGYTTMLLLGSRGLSYATSMVLQTAIKLTILALRGEGHHDAATHHLGVTSSIRQAAFSTLTFFWHTRLPLCWGGNEHLAFLLGRYFSRAAEICWTSPVSAFPVGRFPWWQQATAGSSSLSLPPSDSVHDPTKCGPQ
ncbi:hypothetical protein HPB50_020728 [Hyalomma asiaticum]|uniref:Uncharacterized protein n=1 Tax=Hyalomma asiaticum TaxID=266040 RepID=A0ACB7TJE8_HYAAI|nr:hypothetical protein HPB50_020728 [Hyalomma asiaticum]